MSVCVCMGAWVYGYWCMCVYGCMGVWVYVCVWVHGCRGVCMCVYGCMGVWVLVYGCMGVYMGIGVWVYMCVRPLMLWIQQTNLKCVWPQTVVLAHTYMHTRTRTTCVCFLGADECF